MSKRAILILVALVAGLGLLAWGMLDGKGTTIAVGDTFEARALPVLAADIEGNSAAANEGELMSSADFAGQWTLVNFWASWCEPCREEAPELQAFYEEHGGENFTVLGVDTLDNSGDGAEFATEHGLTFPSIHDGSGAYHKALGMTGVPESVLVDPQGIVALYRPGPLTPEYLNDFVLPMIQVQAEDSAY